MPTQGSYDNRCVIPSGVEESPLAAKEDSSTLLGMTKQYGLSCHPPFLFGNKISIWNDKTEKGRTKRGIPNFILLNFLHRSKSKKGRCEISYLPHLVYCAVLLAKRITSPNVDLGRKSCDASPC